MIGFVVLHYSIKTISNTIDCINSINEKFSNVQKSIVVVENGSNDQSYETLLSYSKILNFKLLRSVNNLGFARGNNLGVKYLMKFSPQFYIVMNNDIIIKNFDYQRLRYLHKTYNFSAFGPRIISANNYDQNPVQKVVKGKIVPITFSILKHRLLLSFIGNLLTRIIHIIDMLRFNKNLHKNDEILVNKPLFGAFIVFSREYVDYSQGNIFYPDTFMFLEEDILYYLLRKQGRITLIDYRFEVYHLEDASTNSVFLTPENKRNFKVSNIIESLLVFKKLIKERTL